MLVKSLGRWSESRLLNLGLVAYESGEELQFKQEEHLDADLYILDIEMKQVSGLDTARWIRKWNKEAGIMFITGYDKFVFEGYSVKAIAYLLKPYEQSQLEQCLDSLLVDLEKKRSFFLCRTCEGMVKIFFDDIIWIQSDDHYIIIQTAKEQIRGRCSLEDVKKELPAEAFFQPHRSYVVSFHQIKRIGRAEIKMYDESMIPLARGKWESLNEKYMDYVRMIGR